MLEEDKSTKNASIDLFRRRTIARFIEQDEKDSIKCNDLFVKSIIKAYRIYYREVLLAPSKGDLLEKNLTKTLKDIASSEGITLSPRINIEKLEKILKEALRSKGYFSLFGIVKPFRSLMIWKNEKRKSFSVVLPEKIQKVDVVFLDQFVELGWLHYATFGKYYVGGWAKKDALFCVKQAYKVNSRAMAVGLSASGICLGCSDRLGSLRLVSLSKTSFREGAVAFR